MEQRRKLEAALNRMRNRKLSQAWETWQYWYEDMMYQKDLLSRPMMMWMKNLMARAFNTWRACPEGPPEPVYRHTRQVSRKKWKKVTNPDVLYNPEALGCVWLTCKNGDVVQRM